MTATDPPTGAATKVWVKIRGSLDLLKGAVMELPNYELVRYPSGQLIITKSDAKSAFRDVVAVYSSEAEAQRALERLTNQGPAGEAPAHAAAPLPRVA
ncbi:MAG TPA: hypothetical protein VKF35_23485 [Hyphomicrobiaceae bacterium]|nr:hypothetical protein [Hyphomicrobiaceae bacterium]